MSFYRNGSSLAPSLSLNSRDQFDRGAAGHSSSGSMYEFPSGPINGTPVSVGIEQKLDMVVSLVLEQKAISAKIEKDTNDLKGDFGSLVSDVAYLKGKVEHSANGSSASGSVQKKIPSQLSVSFVGGVALHKALQGMV